MSDDWLVKACELAEPYPSIIEFGLERDVFALFLVLGAEDLEFGGFESTVEVSVGVNRVLLY